MVGFVVVENTDVFVLPSTQMIVFDKKADIPLHSVHL